MPDTAAPRTNTKAELLTHARRLFAQRGYEGVSMRDIAGSVGVRQSAIYNHFASKQILLVDLMVSHMEVLLDAVQSAVKPDDDPAKRLETFVRFHVSYHINHPDDVFLAYMELRSLEDEGRKAVLSHRDAYEQVLRDILKAGVATGAFQIGDLAVTTRGILAMLTGVTVWFRDEGRLDATAVAETYVQAALQSVG
ncbi:TetR/AcrR family transcriptional regulator, partial [bacterium]|nr:TetR/AcrR family transcriptional regulator [bacterium]